MLNLPADSRHNPDALMASLRGINGPEAFDWQKALQCAAHSVLRSPASRESLDKARIASDAHMALENAALASVVLAGTLDKIRVLALDIDGDAAGRITQAGKAAADAIRSHGGRHAQGNCSLALAPFDAVSFALFRQRFPEPMDPLNWQAILGNVAGAIDAHFSAQPDSQLPGLTSAWVRGAATAMDETAEALARIAQKARSVDDPIEVRLKWIAEQAERVLDRHGRAVQEYESVGDATGHNEMADFISSHGFGSPTNAAVSIGLMLLEDDHDVAQAAANVVSLDLPGLLVPEPGDR